MRILAGVLVMAFAVPCSAAPLGVVVSQEWVYTSENSAIVYWQTKWSAAGFVEYGPTKAYGRETELTGLPPRKFFKGVFDRTYHSQFHRLTGLEPDKVYYYRVVMIDNQLREFREEGKTLRTRKIEGAIHIPGDLKGGPPYELKKKGATYVLTEDINADGTGIIIANHGITLDLNGHTIVYGNAPGESHGVKLAIWNKRDTKVFNGILKQGKANGAKCHPIRARTARKMIVAGVDMTYGGKDCHGIFWRESTDVHAHHNVIYDTGTHITNRHQGLDAIHGCNTSHHNLVKRARHRGIRGGQECSYNEIYLDSWATNSFGIAGGLKNHHNFIFGTGYMPMGIGYGWGDSLEPKEIYDNYILLIAQKIKGRSKEYGDSSNLSGLRVTMYHFRGENFYFHDNKVYLRGKHATKMRGLWISPTPKTKNILFENNYVEVMADETSKVENCMAVSICGTHSADQDPVILEGNTIVSNICNVRFAESYGTGCNVKFIGNTFYRFGKRPDYRMVRCGWWVSDTYGHVFRDSKFQGGAGYDQVFFEGGLTKLTGRDAQGSYAKMTGRRELTVEWTLKLSTQPWAEVEIKDAAGKIVFSGKADKYGALTIPLAQYKQVGEGPYDKGGSKKIMGTPHTVTVKADGKTATKQVTMDSVKELVLKP